MSRLDYHTILDQNVNLDVDAEFDNPTIPDDNDNHHHDGHEQMDGHEHDDNGQFQIDNQENVTTLLGSEGERILLKHGEEEMGTDNLHQSIMDDEQDDTPFVIIEEGDENNHGILSQSHDNNESISTASVGIESIEIPLPFTSTSQDDHQEPNTNLHSQNQESPSIPSNSYDNQIDTPTRSRHSYLAVSLKGWTEEEKKRRQKEQNRKAAERSRNKRKGDQQVVEQEVERLQDENTQLRLRLSTLLASKALNSPPVDSSTLPITTSQANIQEDPISSSSNGIHSPIATEAEKASMTPLLTGTGIDYNYINKLQGELTNSKTMLMERRLKLNDLKMGIVVPEENGRGQETRQGEDVQASISGQAQAQELNDVNMDSSKEELLSTRKSYLNNFSKLISVKAEESSLQFLLKHLKGEIESLNKQSQLIRERLDKRGDHGNGEGGTGDDGKETQEEPSSSDQDQINVQPDSNTNTSTNPIVSIENTNIGSNGPDSEEENISVLPVNVENVETDLNQPTQEEINQDKALEDIRGWIDAAVKEWDQNLPLPQTSHP